MPWGGIPPSQLFTRSNGFNTGSDLWQQDDAGGVDIESNRHDTHDQDLADGMSRASRRRRRQRCHLQFADGRVPAYQCRGGRCSHPLCPLLRSAGWKGRLFPTVGGTADAITLTTGYSVGAYAAGQTFRFIAGGTNTTAGTVIVDGISLKDIKRRESGTALDARVTSCPAP